MDGFLESPLLLSVPLIDSHHPHFGKKKGIPRKYILTNGFLENSLLLSAH